MFSFTQILIYKHNPLVCLNITQPFYFLDCDKKFQLKVLTEEQQEWSTLVSRTGQRGVQADNKTTQS